LARAFSYFVCWIGSAHLLNKWSVAQDQAASNNVALGLAERAQTLSGPGLVLYVLTVTFAAFDWLMSLEPHWGSTIFGLLILGGQALSAFAFAIIVTAWLANYQPLAEKILPSHFHDLGKLLLAFVMLWAYFSLSQYLIIWSGNLPE